ncbi:hypothetical protein [Lacrimispora sp.]|nr:hypothetical protein [Lacrimispora sp.]
MKEEPVAYGRDTKIDVNRDVRYDSFQSVITIQAWRLLSMKTK